MKDSSQARSELREIMTSLTDELATTRNRLAAEQQTARALEERAMAVIRSGDDATARRMMLEQKESVENAQMLEADVIVLEEMIAQCESVLSRSPT
jgi:hypothetical protein